MNFGNMDDIRQNGFEGFVRIRDLQGSNCCEAPDKPGVYLVLSPTAVSPDFLSESIGGHFKGKNPTVTVVQLERKWVKGALVLNIGKAGPGKATLRSRLKQYMRFGRGEPVGHQGGRYIWQLQHSSDLLVCWKTLPDINSRIVENQLIREFETAYHKLPFANLCH